MHTTAGINIDEHEVDEDASRYCRIDEYWFKVQEIIDACVKKKYSCLWTLVKCLLSLSHGNADPERGFSLNKFVLNVHGSSLSNDTIEAL